MGRPLPPASLLDPLAPATFTPAPDLEAWMRDTFIEEGSTLENPEHAHLRFGVLGVLWTNVGNVRQTRRVVGQCEVGAPRGTMGKWPRARAEQQILEWFGEVPDFILTFDGGYASQCSDAEFCALVEHELCHAAQELDAFGAPKFRMGGKPAFAIKGHDVEEFVSVVRRYGAAAAGVQAMVEAAKGRPEVAEVFVSQACGTCSLKAA